MRHANVFRAWRRILKGQKPVLSLEVTNKCPLSCPGCYAYQPSHVSGLPLETIPDFRDQDLVDRVLTLLDQRRPLGVFLVGGEPLVRVRELSQLLPEICRRRIEVEVVTSGVVPIPAAWDELAGLQVVISIDGLQPDHDRRRHPATYERILRNVAGRRVAVHCTVTSQMAERPHGLDQFLEFWSDRPEVGSIRMSLYTPQVGEESMEMLSPAARSAVIAELAVQAARYPKLRMNGDMVDSYQAPPSDPGKCIFSRVTECLSADLKSPVTPCQLGGTPDCSQCGCVAAVGLEAVGRHRFPGGIRVQHVFRASRWIGRRVRSLGGLQASGRTGTQRPVVAPVREAQIKTGIPGKAGLET